LEKPEEDVALIFRSSPFGAVSHSHANNNDFILHVGGHAPILRLLEAQRIPFEPEASPGLMVLIPNRDWLRPAGFANAGDAVERLFRATPPIRWHRDGF
jgi:hypothetical protein